MTMRTFLSTLVVFVLITLSFAGVNMKEGMWEITSKMEMPDMPMEMPAHTYTQCLTKDDMIPKGKQSGHCKISDVKINGNTATWIMKCEDANSTTAGNGKITYDGDTFTGVINMKISNPGQPVMPMTNTMQGKRIGDCE